MNIPDLLAILKLRLSKFTCSVADEILAPNDISYTRYNSDSLNWVSFPKEKIRVINLAGVETFIYPTDYAVNTASGYITFSAARLATDTVKADYDKQPFTDAELTSIIESAVKQIRILIFHAIDVADISVNYSEAIIKRAYTIALRELQFPTTKYFALSIAGRSIDKSSQLNQIEALIASNEKDLLQDVNVLRYFDRTNVIE